MDENHIATFDSDLSVENQSLESTNNNQQSIIESASFTPIIVEPIDELQIEIDNSYKSLIDNIVNARQVCNKLKERKVNYQKTIETQKAIVDELKKNNFLSHETSQDESRAFKVSFCPSDG
ncbi:hypothetical protein VSS37_06740 [Candidatus Thiothrix sp. Deng01]|uniref:FtsK gamma domain-containing protein n=1 Tax=Candidatus Thiothrix phosphatis TaxID=3112415 RepID=A0ABU6CV62_9GAMM|nr:hypothetical protein [Candidatus Thiothrix sp. Deng01]MEB4590669.1 hypothetical protein [Candidatus Thiothrix sp. Deng01]